MSEDRNKAFREARCRDWVCLDNPRCPHCGEASDVCGNELYDLFDEGEHSVECANILCGMTFTVETNVSYSYTTIIEDEDEEEPQESETSR